MVDNWRTDDLIDYIWNSNNVWKLVSRFLRNLKKKEKKNVSIHIAELQSEAFLPSLFEYYTT